MPREEGYKNLIPLSTDEARSRGKAGGKASGKARREKRMFQEAVIQALNAKTQGGGTELTEIVAALIKKAKEGDARAFETLRDTTGEKPTNKIEATTTNDNKELMREYLATIKRGNP